MNQINLFLIVRLVKWGAHHDFCTANWSANTLGTWYGWKLLTSLSKIPEIVNCCNGNTTSSFTEEGKRELITGGGWLPLVLWYITYNIPPETSTTALLRLQLWPVLPQSISVLTTYRSINYPYQVYHQRIFLQAHLGSDKRKRWSRLWTRSKSRFADIYKNLLLELAWLSSLRHAFLGQLSLPNNFPESEGPKTFRRTTVSHGNSQE